MRKPEAPTTPVTRFSKAARPTFVVNSRSVVVVSVWT
jgi:hypothetical protein